MEKFMGYLFTRNAFFSHCQGLKTKIVNLSF